MTDAGASILEKPPRNVIIRMPNWLGDLVMATPLLADIRRAWPDARITAMAQHNVAPLLQEDPNIDELYAFHRPSGWLHRQPRRDIIETLRKGNYDLGILTTNSFSSAYWFWRSSIPTRLGFEGHSRKWLLTHPKPVPEGIETSHLVVTYKKLLTHVGIPVSDSSPHLYLSEKERTASRALLAKHGVAPDDIIVGINPGAAYGSAKCWLPSRFRQVTQRLLENPRVRIAYFGDPKGAPLVKEICVGMPERVIDLAGKTSIRELMALIDQCHVFLTNDSGPMHMAAALNKPLVALFGSTNDTKTGPYKIGKVIHKRVECSPCYKRECPIDFRCMTRIGVDEVYQELRDLVEEVQL